MSDIATLKDASKIMDTVHKFLHVLTKTKITLEQLRHPIDSIDARSALELFIMNDCSFKFKLPILSVTHHLPTRDDLLHFMEVKFPEHGPWEVIEEMDERVVQIPLSIASIHHTPVPNGWNARERLNWDKEHSQEYIRVSARAGMLLLNDHRFALEYLYHHQGARSFGCTGTIFKDGKNRECYLVLTRDEGHWRAQFDCFDSRVLGIPSLLLKH